MKLTITRDILTPNWTLGVMHVDGLFYGYVVEDYDRLHHGEAKVKARTAIPAGTYDVRFTWSPKFNRNVPEVMHVPGFQGIRIHAGNDADDTEGCILPGLRRDKTKGTVSHSADAVRWLEDRIIHTTTTLTIGYELPDGFELPPKGQ